MTGALYPIRTGGGVLSRTFLVVETRVRESLVSEQFSLLASVDFRSLCSVFVKDLQVILASTRRLLSRSRIMVTSLSCSLSLTLSTPT